MGIVTTPVLALLASPLAAEPSREPVNDVRIVLSRPAAGSIVRNRTDVAAEVIALRHQIAVLYNRQPRLSRLDRIL